MDPRIDLEAVAVGKRYRRGRPPSLTAWAREWWRGVAYDEFWALRDLTIAVPHGQVLGVIGENGAGKSTFLKLLSGITAPTTGEIRYRGRLAALIEVGSGFHPELTGRENVFMSGAILGMSRREIASKFDSIVEFAGVGAFIDTPVKWYSSGMYVRLGFAVAAHVDPDILLVDEVLAVGDESFQDRCFRRVAELRARGTTVIFISHDLVAVERLCDRVVLLRGGRVVMDDAPAQVVSAYHESLSIGAPLAAGGTPAVRIESIRFTPSAGICTGDRLVAFVDVQADRAVADATVTLAFATNGGAVVHAELRSDLGGRVELPHGRSTVEFIVEAIGLQPGAYSVSAAAVSGADPGDLKMAPHRLLVRPGRRVRGYFYMPHEVRVRDGARAGVA